MMKRRMLLTLYSVRLVLKTVKKIIIQFDSLLISGFSIYLVFKIGSLFVESFFKKNYNNNRFQ